MNNFLNEYFGFWFELNFESNHFEARFNEKMFFEKDCPPLLKGLWLKGLWLKFTEWSVQSLPKSATDDLVEQLIELTFADKGT